MSISNKNSQLDLSSLLYILFVGFFWLYGFFGAFWRLVGVDANIVNSILLFALALGCWRRWIHRVRFSDIVLYILIVLMYFISIFFYPNSADQVLSNAFEVLCVAAPFLFVGIIIKDKDYSSWLVFLSRLAIIINIVFSVLLSSSGSDVEESQHRAYLVLPSVLYILGLLLERYRIIDFIFFALGFLMVCSLGTRGPFVCVLFFAFVYLFFIKELKHPTLIRVMLVVVSVLLYLLSTYFATFMIHLLSSFGQSTRIFENMLDSSLINLENSSGRDLIYEGLLRRLSMDYRGIGYGLFSDRIYAGGFSSHNIIIELWFSFGYFGGTVLLAIIMILFLKFFFQIKDIRTKMFGLVFFTVSFVKLMFSGCFILDWSLYFVIGYCINGLRESRTT